MDGQYKNGGRDVGGFFGSSVSINWDILKEAQTRKFAIRLIVEPSRDRLYEITSSRCLDQGRPLTLHSRALLTIPFAKHYSNFKTIRNAKLARTILDKLSEMEARTLS